MARRDQLLLAALGAAVLLVIGMIFLRGARSDSLAGAEAEAARLTREAAERAQAERRAAAEPPTPTRRPPPQPAATNIVLTGRVSAADTEGPLPGARVRLIGQGEATLQETTTTTDGNYTITVAGRDAWRAARFVVAEAEGYAARREALPVASARETRFEINMVLARAVTLEGIVVDREGNGVPGAEVGVLVGRDWPRSPAANPYVVAPVVQTDAQGRFTIEGMPEGEAVQLYARHERYSPAFSPRVTAGGRVVRIALREAESIVTGQVFDQDGKPMAGVAVTATYRPGGPGFRMPTPYPDADLVYTTTDETGTYRLATLRSGWQTIVATEDARLVRSTGKSLLLEAGETKVFNMKFDPTAVITGVFVEKGTDRPVQGVTVLKPNGRLAAPEPGDVMETIVTGIDGRFTVELPTLVSAGMIRNAPLFYRLPAAWNPLPDEWLRHEVRGTPPPAGEIRIEIERGVMVTGIVYMPDAQSPAVGAEAGHLFNPGNLRGFGGDNPMAALVPFINSNRVRDLGFPSATTDNAGRFTLRLIPGQEGMLFARHGDGLSMTPYVAPQADNTEPVVMILMQTASIGGVATGPGGEPLAGVRVTARQIGSLMRDGQSAVTDAEGRYRIEGLMPVQAIVSAVAPEGAVLAPPEAQTINLTGGLVLNNVDWKFGTAAIFEGVVVNQAGEPVPGARVIRRERGRGGNWQARFMSAGNAQGTVVETGADGRFLFNDVPAEDRVFDLTVTHPSYDEKRLEELFPDDSPVRVELSPRSAMELTAWEEAGAQVVTFEYAVAPAAGQRGRERRNDAEGRVFMQVAPVRETLSPGKYRAHVYTLGNDGRRDGRYGFAEFDVAAGEVVSVRVNVGAAVTVTGIVVNSADSAPIANANVTLTQLDEGGVTPQNRWRQPPRNTERSLRTGADGRFAFDFARPGRVRLSVSAEGFVLDGSLEPFIIETGKAVDPITIRMRRGGTITGTVTGPDGRALSGMTVRLGGGWSNNRTTTGNDGGFKFENVPFGEARVALLSSSSSLVDEQRVAVNADKESEVTFNLAGRVRVSGEFRRNGARDNSNGFEISLIGGEESGRVTMNANRGRFEQYIRPGSYRVEVPVPGANGRANTGKTVTVSESPLEQEINIEVEFVSVGVVIVDGDGRDLPRTDLQLDHRFPDGTRQRIMVPTTRRLFYVDNLPPGEVRGRIELPGGRILRSIWTEVGTGRENIMTLVPEDI
jgi:protocatechuate 3,4-dioxygenase beta subunit